ncbi:MAG: alpha/beta hydrolase [Isosphaeraceae bacterium]|nr:alpha/beta hydrolase [Isosphaeraceae bacterium]
MMRISRIFLPSILLFGISTRFASAQVPAPEVVELWSGKAPGAVGTTPADRPRITVHRPDPAKATGAAVVVCPGGGYGHLALDHEGKQIAAWLNDLGITACVLEYRIAPRYRHPAPIQDAQRAIRLVRKRSSEWGVDPNRVAILGFSAGGHLASTAATHYDKGNPEAGDPVDRLSCRPDRVILLYPVVALATSYAHGGSRNNLLGPDPDPALLTSLSNETQVDKDTPPTFLAHTNEDKPVPAENSILFVLALRKAGVPVEFHLFESGRHGLGLGGGDKAFAEWPKLCATWLGKQGFLERR